jgi:hypothetical protein
MAMTPNERKEKQALFLTALGKCASIKQAALVAGVSRATVYRWQQSSATFRAAVEEANKEANDTIDDEIVRRAIEGIEEPLVSMGKLVFLEEPLLDEDEKPLLDEKNRPILRIVGQVKVRKYSDPLLLALAKSRMKKYRDRVDLDLLEQINEQTGGALQIPTKDLTAEELAQLKQIGLNIKARTEEKR